MAIFFIFEFLPNPDKIKRAFISLLASVVLKLAKKEISHRGGTKPIKIKLEYHEAYCLENTISSVLDEGYDRELQNIYSQIHQKLS